MKFDLWSLGLKQEVFESAIEWGVYTKVSDFKMLGKMIKFGTWIIKIGYKIRECSTEVSYVLFNVIDSLHCLL